MEIRPQHRAVDGLGQFQHVMVIVPIDAEIDEAQHVREKYGQYRLKGCDVGAVRYLHFQHQDRDDDGDDAVAERLESVRFHRAGAAFQPNFHHASAATAAGTAKITRKIGASSATG